MQTADEVWDLGFRKTCDLSDRITDNKPWLLGNRRKIPKRTISDYFEHDKGPAICYFRKVIRHLVTGGFSNADFKSQTAVRFQRSNNAVLRKIRELEPYLAQTMKRGDVRRFRRALLFFQTGSDRFFDTLPQYEPLVRDLMKHHRHEAFCIATLKDNLEYIERAFAEREMQLRKNPGNIATLPDPEECAATKEDVSFLRLAAEGAKFTAEKALLSLTILKRSVTLEGEKTRKAVKASAKKIIHDLISTEQSDYEKRGPKSSARRFQVGAVISRLKEFAADKEKLPFTLRSKHPDKWIHQACTDIWKTKPGAYPTLASLYIYCHRNESKLLSLAGL